MNVKVRRPISVYVFMGLWILWASYKSTVSSTPFGQFSWITLDLLVAVNLLNILRKTNYFELTENKVIINRDYFRTQVVDLDKIEKIWIEPGPFKSSKIILKDKTEVKFNDSYADSKELKEFMVHLQIPIE
jgi:hypothetical protein